MVEQPAGGTTSPLNDEEKRLNILRSYHILDTPAEEDFDILTRLAAQICGMPISTVTLVDETRQWFKSRIGLNLQETSRAVAFCDHVLRSAAPMVVPDTLEDARLRDNPLVTGEPHLRFYIGVPLVSPENAVIGTFCVMDRQPRTVTPDQMESLIALARQAMAQLELRRQKVQLGEMLTRERMAREAAERAEARFHAAFDNVVAGVAIADSTGRLVQANSRFCDLLGYTQEESLQLNITDLNAPEDWQLTVHPLQKLLRGEIPHFTLDKHYLHKSGRKIPVRISISRMHQDDSWHTVALVLDLTQERQATEQLRRNQWLARLAGEAAHVGGWAIDAETQELLWSEEVRAIHEAPPEYVPSLKEGLALFTPEWQPIVKLAVQNCLRHGVPYDLEVEKFTFQGRRIWVRTIGQAERDENGKIIRIHGAFQDITEVRSARIEVARIANQLRTTLESISDAFFTIDRDWRFTYLNVEAQRILNRPARELIGRKIWDQFPRAAGSELAIQYTHALRDNIRVRFEHYYEPLQRWFQISAYPSSEGLAVYFQDVTDRRIAQERLQKAWARTRRILETSLDVIAMLDRDGRFVEVNSRCLQVWGFTQEELTGRLAAELVHPADRAATVAEWAGNDALSGGTIAQCRSIRKDGEVIHVQWSSVWSEPDQLHFIVVRDVTAQVLAEERLRQSQRLEAIGQLTGGVAHDFNNLLTVVLGSSDLLVEELAANERLRTLAGLIRTAALRGAELTRGLLAFARRQVLEPRTIAVPKMLERMQTLLHRSLGETIEFEIICPAGLWPVTADPSQLESALLNLCLNARDAMPEGGHLIIETRNVVLDERYAQLNADVIPGSYVALVVSDNGCGMTPEVLARAFDPFFTTKDRDKGTGLGLSMVYGFAKQSGGHVKIYSEPGHGATVKLYVPRSTEMAEEQEAPDPKPAARGLEHILVVEDDELVREFAADLLASLGYRVTVAHNGEEALAAVQAGGDFDLLFTDVVMPGMNGPQLAQEVLKLCPDLPVLFTSGYMENAIVRHDRIDAGVNLLHKPYRRQTLAEKVRQMLAGRGPER